MNQLIESVYHGVTTPYEHVMFVKPPKNKSEYSVYFVDTSHTGADCRLGIVTYTVSIEVYSSKNTVSDTQKKIQDNLNKLAIEFDVALTVRTEPDQTFMTLITFTKVEKGGISK